MSNVIVERGIETVSYKQGIKFGENPIQNLTVDLKKNYKKGTFEVLPKMQNQLITDSKVDRKALAKAMMDLSIRVMNEGAEWRSEWQASKASEEPEVGDDGQKRIPDA